MVHRQGEQEELALLAVLEKDHPQKQQLMSAVMPHLILEAVAAGRLSIILLRHVLAVLVDLVLLSYGSMRDALCDYK